MSAPVNIGSSAEWQSMLSGNSVVVADFYADWCGPCKQIAPHFERLAKEHSRPKKVAFAKVNVDNQSTIAQSNGVAAMPTFKIFHNGNCVETIKGANPSALAASILNAVKLADGPGGAKGDVFKTPGRTLGNEKGAGSSATRAWGFRFDFNKIFNFLVMFVGLYLVSLFSFDAFKAAENSRFNANKPAQAQPKQGKGPVSGGANGKKPAPKPAFRTLADIGSE